MEIKISELGSLSAKVLVEIIGLFAKTFSFIACIASDPLFSIVVVLYSLIFLYFPRVFLGLVFSPVLFSTGILLLTLLRLGTIQRLEKENNSTEPDEIDTPDEDHKWVGFQTFIETETEMGLDSEPFFSDSFVEWNVRAPLEVIYEEYEGEEEEDLNENEETRQVGIKRMPSLSLYYPESDTESSSDGDFPGVDGWDSLENMCFRWDEEEREGLIEIPLDGKKNSVFQVEEENLIEIDIQRETLGFPAKWDSVNPD
ncbi:hypothetical protein HHK36_023730 [Tetracentron sinense]|uniref:Transmembrane protein n=1 Tax=Tetracentron sinense TaxID=13715 RepID=A0A834YQP4_TETSI|nr:hypothetical protein HHK36_023730 [Tetracentron sinense]